MQAAAGKEEDMSITVNGQSRVPPGFRFHPTEEELLNYYLRKKVSCEKIDLDVIRDVDLNKLEPWDIQEKCRVGSTPQNDWYFFSHKDKKYPTGTRTNRATAAGFWKATGRDKVIYTSFKRIGMRKTLVFYKGRAPQGQKSDWIMHEYRLDDLHSESHSSASTSIGELVSSEEGWVVCRVFKKKNYHKVLDSPSCFSTTTTDGKRKMASSSSSDSDMIHSSSDRALSQILQYMGRSCKQEEDPRNRNNTARQPTRSHCTASFAASVKSTSNSEHLLTSLPPIDAGGLLERFMKLPALDSPSLPSSGCALPYLDVPCSYAQETSHHHQPEGIQAVVSNNSMDASYSTELSDWAALDRLVATHLNGPSESSRELDCFDDPNYCCASGGAAVATRLIVGGSQDYNDSHGNGGDMDLWAFVGSTSSSPSDHLCRGSFVSE